MTYLLDTNACIKYLNGQSERIRQQLESKTPRDIVLCSVVKAELFYGAMKSANFLVKKFDQKKACKSRKKFEEDISIFKSFCFFSFR